MVIWKFRYEVERAMQLVGLSGTAELPARGAELVVLGGGDGDGYGMEGR